MMLMTTTTTRKTTRMTSTRTQDMDKDGRGHSDTRSIVGCVWRGARGGGGMRWDEVAGVINNRQVAHALEHNYPLQRHRQVRVCVWVCVCVSARKGSARRGDMEEGGRYMASLRHGVRQSVHILTPTGKISQDSLEAMTYMRGDEPGAGAWQYCGLCVYVCAVDWQRSQQL